MREPVSSRTRKIPPIPRMDWFRVLREACAAAALAALRVLLDAVARAYPGIARRTARGKPGVRPHQPRAA